MTARLSNSAWSATLGWASTAGILGLYLLLAAGLVAPSAWYFAANALSSGLMVVYAFERRAWPVAGLNAMFTAISAFGAWRLL